MRLIADEAKIKTRTRTGELAPLVGLALLIIAIALAFLKPAWIWVALILIWLGFVASMMGGYLGGRYVGPLAHHKKVPEALKGLENSFTLLMYKTPVPFVVMDAGGLTTVLVRGQNGRITYQNGKWRHKDKWGWLKRFAGQESLGRPDQLALLEAEDLRRFLHKRLPEGIDVPVRPVILFVHPDAIVEAADSPVPVFRESELKRWLRREGRRPNLPKETVEALYAALRIEAED